MENAFDRGGKQAGLAEHILFMSSQLGRSIGISLAPFIRNSVLLQSASAAAVQPFMRALYTAAWCWFGMVSIALVLSFWGFWPAGSLVALRKRKENPP
jgi:hypothetical protein